MLTVWKRGLFRTWCVGKLCAEAGWDYTSFDKDEAGFRKDVQASATDEQTTDAFQKNSKVKGLQNSWPPPGTRMMMMVITLTTAPPPPN